MAEELTDEGIEGVEAVESIDSSPPAVPTATDGLGVEIFAELLEESLATLKMEPGSIVTGTVVEVDKEFVLVHAGLKSEGVIPRSQFLNEDGEFSLAVGDQVQVAMETVDDGWGETRLSREKARRAESWQMLESAFSSRP